MSHTLSIADLIPAASSPARVAAGIQQAIDSLAQRGGGLVSIPPGLWVSTMITLRSGITLRIERGATLRAHSNLDDYPVMSAYAHNKDRQPYHLLYADNADDITIEGDGIIDGQGPAFWDPPTGQGWAGRWSRSKPRRVSPLLEIKNCRRVKLRDFTIIDSPGWTVHLNECDHVTVRGITIANDLFGPNTDGIDVNGCRDVFISDCAVRGGDDNIILKAMKGSRTCERIVVTNCILQSNCAALGLGAETTCGIRDIAFSNCAIESALRIVQLEMWEDGFLDNIAISNIVGRTLSGMVPERPIYIDIQQHRRGDGAPLGRVRNVTISNFAVETRGRIILTAQDGATIDHVTLRDIQLTYPDIEDPHLSMPQSGSNQNSNYNPHSRAQRAVVIADNVKNLSLQNISTTWPQTPNVPMHAAYLRNTQAFIDSPNLRPSHPNIEPLLQSNSHLQIRAIAQ